MSAYPGTAALARFGVAPAALYVVCTIAVSWLTTFIKFPAAHATMMSLTMGIFLAVLLLSETRDWILWSALAYAIDVLACITLHGEPAGRAAAEGAGHALVCLLTAISIRPFSCRRCAKYCCCPCFRWCRERCWVQASNVWLIRWSADLCRGWIFLLTGRASVSPGWPMR